MKENLWINKDAESATGGKSTMDWCAGGVSIDSRKINKGDLFIAIEGDNFDGHNFVKAAFENGATAAVVTHVPDDLSENMPLLIVNSTMEALRDLAKI